MSKTSFDLLCSALFVHCWSSWLDIDMTPDEFDEEFEASDTNGESGESGKKDFIMKYANFVNNHCTTYWRPKWVHLHSKIWCMHSENHTAVIFSLHFCIEIVCYYIYYRGPKSTETLELDSMG